MTTKQFLNTHADCQWLRETHLKALPMVHDFKSYMLHGNEDAPDAVVLFRSDDPLHTDLGMKVLIGDGTFALIPNSPAF